MKFESIKEYALAALKLRTGIDFDLTDEAVRTAAQGDLCRIIHSGDKLAVFCRDDIKMPLLGFLNSINVKEAIKSPDFYFKILTAVGLDPVDYPYEPACGAEDIDYKCCHTVEYVCSAETFIMPPDIHDVKIIRPGDPNYPPLQGFSEVFAIFKDGRSISDSYYRPNTGNFSGTNAINVWTHSSFRRRGYGKATASAATHTIVTENELALWVSYADNAASRRIAEGLGYAWIGGELRIRE